MNRSDESANLPQPGDVLAGKYRIERVIGKGGMGIVYAAHHEILAQPVAVKLLLSEIAQARDVVARFINEARAAARIQSDHVARVMDVGTLEAKSSGNAALPYMVMEYLEGEDLAHVLESSGPLPVTDAVDYVLQALEALVQAHLLGIVHRDLKPANLFLVKRHDRTRQIKVLDFGISKATNPLTNAASTSTSSMLGTPYYMAPEQLRNAKNVDARADIWSLGVLLHELLAGSLPFNGETLGELFLAIVEREPPSLCTLRPGIPPPLADVVLRCMRREPTERYRSVSALANALLPFGSARGLISAQRVMAAMPSDVGPHVTPSPEPAGASPLSTSLAPQQAALTPPAFGPSSSLPRQLGGTPAATAGSWVGTHGGATGASGGGRSQVVTIVAVVGLVLLGAGMFGVRHVMTKGAAAPTGAPPTEMVGTIDETVSAPIAPLPPPVVSAAVPLVLEPVPVPTGTPSPPSRSAPAPPSPAAPTNAKAMSRTTPPSSPTAVAPSSAPSAPSAPSAAANVPRPAASHCNPPYTFDAGGRKIWKKECL